MSLEYRDFDLPYSHGASTILFRLGASQGQPYLVGCRFLAVCLDNNSGCLSILLDDGCF
jgi:hypothetical protein